MEYGHLNPNIVNKYRFPKSGYRVNVEALASELGLSVEVTDLPLEISGSLEREGNRYTIKVEKSEPNGRQQFVIAHELGHYALHKEHIGDGVKETYLLRSEVYGDKKEQEANAFAADLIMPYKNIKKAIGELTKAVGEFKNKKGASENILADAFGVSTLAMSIRLGIQA